MKTVCVLMSVFNGEKYLKEQIESILSQENVYVILLARDDGSTDSSIDILNEYRDRIHILEGENVGIIKSFSLLVEEGLNIKCDYYAFSDQDDVWKQSKLINAVEKLNQLSNALPSLYFSNLEYTDENLESMGYVYNTKPDITKRSSLVWNYAYGCTEVFNRKTAELFCKGLGKRIWMHDFWIYLIGVHLGNYYYDETAYILYRQHGSNSVGYNLPLLKKIRNKLKSLKKLNETPRVDMAEDFLSTYVSLLGGSNKKIIRDFIQSKYCIRMRLSALFSKEYYIFNVTGNIILRIRFLIGAV